MSRLPASAFARSSLQLPRAAAGPLRPRATPASRRWASGAAPRIRYGFRGGLLRLAVAGGGVYWYATRGSQLFADGPAYVVPGLPETEREDETLPTVDEVHAARKQRQTQTPAPADVGELEEEAEGQGAFNPETGEINWDCPCLGGMADGPCGPEFKEAFSCFVFSKEEPKGMDCVDRFRGMQDCFRRHPEIYGEELEGDDDEGEAEPGAAAGSPAAPSTTPAAEATKDEAGPAGPHMSAVTAPVPSRAEMLAQGHEDPAATDPHELSSKKLARNALVKEGDELVPRQWHDTTGDNQKADGKEK